VTRVDANWPWLRVRHEQENLTAVGKVFAAMAEDLRGTTLPKAWDGRLADVLLERNLDCAAEFGFRVAAAFDARAATDLDVDAMVPWLTVVATNSAVNINATTRAALAVEDVDPTDVTDELLGRRLTVIASAMVTMAAGFGAKEGGSAAGATVKLWSVNSGNPRSSHSAMSGATAPIEGTFSNGARWPGDPVLGTDGIAGCMCSLVIV